VVSSATGRARGFLISVLCAGALTSACDRPVVENPPRLSPDLASLRVPEGFRVDLFSDAVPEARSMALGPPGVLFLGSRKGDAVRALFDDDGDGRADRIAVVRDGLKMPNGVAYRDGALIVAETSRLWRFDDIDAWLADPSGPAPAPTLIRDDLPDDDWHGWKFIRFAPDGALHVPVGAPCNVCEVDGWYGAIHRLDPETGEATVVARGVRHTVGFDWDTDGRLWFSDNGRDLMGDDVPPDELNRVDAPGRHYGFPFCHGNSIRDPEFGRLGSCDDAVAPVVPFPAHVAALGIRVYRAGRFPAEWLGAIFVAEHGSWNRTVPDGYRVSVVRETDAGWTREVFLEGFLRAEGAFGRPVDVEVWHDGSLLVSDDRGGRIYRIDRIDESPGGGEP